MIVTHNSDVLALELVYVLVPSTRVATVSIDNVVTGLNGSGVKAVEGSGLVPVYAGAVVVEAPVDDAEAEAVGWKTVVDVKVTPAAFVVVNTLVDSPVVVAPVAVVAPVVVAPGVMTDVDVIVAPAALVVVKTLVVKPVCAAVADGVITVVEVSVAPAALVVVKTLVTGVVPVAVPVVVGVVVVPVPVVVVVPVPVVVPLPVPVGVVVCVRVTRLPRMFVVVITVVMGVAAAAKVAGSKTEVLVRASPLASVVTTNDVVTTAEAKRKNSSQTIESVASMIPSDRLECNRASKLSYNSWALR